MTIPPDPNLATPPPSQGSPVDLTQTIVRMHGSRSRPASTERGPGPGSRIGRYVVLSKIGAGGMGVVFAAYDPELDRRVALKLLEPRRRRSRVARARLQREAQALARVNHTNVVTLYDVGVHRGRVFLALELVEGTTLRRWMKLANGRQRPWREVVEVFVAAGRGLAAAHEQGLVHRDFKPDNVMLGADGRVRVMDFGLARAVAGPTARARPPKLPVESLGVPAGMPADTLAEAEARTPTDVLADMFADVLVTPLTNTHAVVGTPAYMAPEQFGGEYVAAHSDQFGFCVALYEALYGIRPFRGDTVAELMYAVTAGGIGHAPQDSRVPSWLRTILRRGLSVAPHERFATMNELLAELRAGGRRRRLRYWLAASGAALAAVAGVVGMQAHPHASHASHAPACARAGDVIESGWSAQRLDGDRSP